MGVEMHAAVIGLGEAGTLYAEGLTSLGWTVTGFDPAPTTTPQGVERAEELAAAVTGAQVVLSLVGGRAAAAVAQQIGAHLEDDAVLLDMNSAAPAVKQQVAEAVGAQRCADVGVVGSVPQGGAATAVVVSGGASARAASVLGALGAPVEDIGGRSGDAARRKLLRSAFMKGVGALVVEMLDGAEAMGARQWALDQLVGELAGEQQDVERLETGTRHHARRRGHEAEESAAMLESFGVPAIMGRAAARSHLLLADTALAPREELLAAALEVPVANIGDARERMGMVAGGITPLWPGARAAGWARTVQVAAGDNKLLHEALGRIRPGDMLVVDGQGFTDRALLGELMAATALRRGAVGIVVDGALRDRQELQELDFPAWARGTSPAGPYKNGPGRLDVPVQIGGVVVRPGDLVVADDDGVIVVPAEEAAASLAAAREVAADEARRRLAIPERLGA
jgi:4-hydroxy-4-methyl-2-oxoglutarate aldolase